MKPLSTVLAALIVFLVAFPSYSQFNIKRESPVIPCTNPVNGVILIPTPSGDTLRICPGNPNAIQAVVSSGSFDSYQWQKDQVNIVGETGLTITVNTPGVYRIVGTNTCGTIASRSIIVITGEGNITPTVSISSNVTTICPNDPVTFTATTTNIGSNPFYQWRLNSIVVGNNEPTFTTTAIVANTQVTLVVNNTTTCSTTPIVVSYPVNITIGSSTPPSVSITASANPFCSGSSVTFTATPVNGGNTSFQWQVNGVNVGTNSNTFTSSTLKNTNQVKVVMLANTSCGNHTVTSNTITVEENYYGYPQIVISGNTTVASGESTLITGAGHMPGNNPQFQWQDSTSSHSWQDIPNATNSTIAYTPEKTGDGIRCILTSSAPCSYNPVVGSNALIFSLTGIVEPGANTIHFYPNPVQNRLFLDKLKLTDEWVSLEIISVNGSPSIPQTSILNQTSKEINVGHLKPGQYIIVLRRKNGSAAHLKMLKL